MGLGCGCGCNGAGGCGGGAPVGSSGSFGYAMSPDGVPISRDLPGYQAVRGTTVGFNADLPDATAPTAAASPAQGLTLPVLGCPLWIWLAAAGLVLISERKGRS